MRKKLGLAFLGLFTLLALWIGWNWQHVRYFPEIISSFTAKEMCSCLYVMELGKEPCVNYARQYIPIQSYSIDEKAKIVTVRGLFRTNSASYQGRRYGCRLQNE